MLLGLLLSVPAKASASPDIESCDSEGNTQDIFDPGEPVYIKGSGLYPGCGYYVYIVEDHEPWIVYPFGGYTTISVLSVAVGPLRVSTDASGYLGPVLIWTAADPGSYDIWADFEGADGISTHRYVYCRDDDIDNMDVDTAGFFVIPGVFFGSIGAVTALFSGLTIKALRAGRRGVNRGENS